MSDAVCPRARVQQALVPRCPDAAHLHAVARGQFKALLETVYRSDNANKPGAASTRVTSNTLMCFHMKQEVFKMVGMQARDKADTRSAMENDATKAAWFLLHAPIYFSSARRRCLTSPTRGPL